MNRLIIQLRQYDGLSCREQQQVFPGEVTFSGARFVLSETEVEGQVTLCLKLISEQAKQVQLSVSFVPDKWSDEVYLMLPAAAYQGNRFKCRRTPYPPKPVCLEDRQEHPELVINDVPRLSQQGRSLLHITTGDEATPSICWYNPQDKTSTVILTRQGNEWGNYGIKIEESEDHRQSVLSIESPVMRQTLYKDCRTDHPSWDQAIDLKAGDEIKITYKLDQRAAHGILDFYAHFMAIRKELESTVRFDPVLPFSAAWDIQHRKLNRDNWNGEYGYYAVGTRNCWEGDNHNVGQDWQPGWTGGGINSLPLLVRGDELSQQRAMETLRFMFARGQSASGLLYAMHHQGTFYDDTFHHETPNKWVMIRKNTDALYFTLKHLIYLKEVGRDFPQAVEQGTKKLADRLLAIWKKYAQWGQFFDVETGELLVGGTLAGALGSGALALASEYFEEPAYLEVAVKAARADYENYVLQGLTTGGPGEILQAPDSESAFAMLESFVVLYEVTGDSVWLPMAEAIAAQCVTWCASYDYQFPEASVFGQRDIRATGSVWANVQNKHSSPGICTFSGDSLFKLFRATGELKYLELIKEISHNLPQYMVREGHPLGEMKEGWICERVNFSDWEGPENVGGNLFGSCWPEAALALTGLELPGLYVQVDTGILQAIDHVTASIVEQSEGGMVLELENPTNYDAEVHVFAETAMQARTRPLGAIGFQHFYRVSVSAGERLQLNATVMKDGSLTIGEVCGPNESNLKMDHLNYSEMNLI